MAKRVKNKLRAGPARKPPGGKATSRLPPDPGEAHRGGVRAHGPAASGAGPSSTQRMPSCGIPRRAGSPPVARVNRVEMSLLKGIDRVRDLLLENTERFARGLPANNALLWGARGMGKSSLVKAVHASVNAAARPPRSSWSRSTARTSRACRS